MAMRWFAFSSLLLLGLLVLLRPAAVHAQSRDDVGLQPQPAPTLQLSQAPQLTLADTWMIRRAVEEREHAYKLRWYGFGLQLMAAVAWGGGSVMGLETHSHAGTIALTTLGSAVSLGFACAALFTSDPYVATGLTTWGLLVQGLGVTTALVLAATNDGCSGDCSRALAATALGTAAFTLAGLVTQLFDPPPNLFPQYERYERTPADERTALTVRVLDQQYARSRRAQRMFLGAGATFVAALVLAAATADRTGTRIALGVNALILGGWMAMAAVELAVARRPSDEIIAGRQPPSD